MTPSIRPASRFPGGFTLIELLIVVAIIAILAAMAVPNYLEAQTRAKISRTKSDMRNLVLAVQAYQVDNNAYPFRHNKDGTSTFIPPMPEYGTRLTQMGVLTTPVAYITSLPIDVFNTDTPPPYNVIDYYDRRQTMWLINSLKLSGFSYLYKEHELSWTLVAVGPDGTLGMLFDTYDHPNVKTPPRLQGTYRRPYDPTNGTTSTGNIYYNEDGGMDQAGYRLMQKFNRGL